MRAAGTRSASSEERVWVVPESLRPVLAEQYGPVYAGKPAEKRIQHLGPFASCGDEVTRVAIATGNLPIVGVVDFKIGRTGRVEAGSYAALSARGRRRVANPAGMLTERLRRAVKEFLLEGGGLLEVDGEEDLAALALVESLPVGATVIYGIPGSGVSFVAVDALSKEHVRGLIAQMELRKIDLGA